MEEYSINSPVKSLFVMARAATWVVLALALLGLAGFLLKTAFLAGGSIGGVPMAPSTALCFMLLAGALLLRQSRHPWGRRAIKTAAALVLLVSAGVLLKRLLAAGQLDTIPLWKMSPYTAGLFMLSAAGLLRLERLKTGSDPASTAISYILLVLSSVILIGYLYGSPFFYGGTTIPVAFTSGLAFAALSVALFASDPESANAAPFFGDSLKAVLFRNFIPLIVLAVLGDGLIDVWGGGILGSKPLEHVIYSLIAMAAGAWLVNRISARIAAQVERTEAALRESEAQYRTLYESSRDALMTLFPPAWAFTSGNPATIEMFGAKDEADFIDRGPWELSPESQPDGELSSVKARRVIETALEKGSHLFEWTHKRIGGPAFPATVLLTRFELGGKTGLQATVRNIAAQKLLEEDQKKLSGQLLQSQKMESVGRLAGGVAHDFNNLLTAITCYAGFLKKDLPEGDPRREDAKEILDAAGRGAGLIRQLLAFSRKQILSPEIVDLNASVGDIVKMLKRLIGESVRLETRLAARACLVKADPGQMDQIIVNLAVNARDAMPGGGALVLETAIVTSGEALFPKHTELLSGPLVCLSISDTGHGMTAEVKEHLFEPFFTTKEAGKGTGLGLATVFGIVNQSGGEIEVESEPGRGTTFRIYLPHSKEVLPAKARDRGRDKSCACIGNETVLLVEDEDSLRRLCERVLRACGYTVIAAAGGKEALEAVERHGKPLDLLLTDVVMPGMNGRELARELDLRKLIKRTLYMSGYTDDAIARHGVLEPGVAFIYKPFTAEALSIKLCEVLDGPADRAKA